MNHYRQPLGRISNLRSSCSFSSLISRSCFSHDFFRAHFLVTYNRSDALRRWYIRSQFYRRNIISSHTYYRPSVSKGFIFKMVSFVKKVLVLAIGLACLIHFGATYTLVPGISVPVNTPVPARLEIRIFAQNATRLNILYLALERMQAITTNQTLSYYQISGIHGTNFAWDNDEGGDFSIDFGYCRHADRLFPTWHRPYLSLYEKTLYDLATQIIAEFPAGTEKNTHLAVLATWRLPYWDWASNAAIPNFLGSSKNVVVTKLGNGTLAQVSIRNPLYSYRLQIANDPNVVVLSNGVRTIETVRNPTVQNNAYVTRASYTSSQMVQQAANLKANVWRALTINTSYNAFSNMADGGNSIEGVHGSVHVITGGNNGHMSYPEYAAFDPIFYFHHANIDRLFALWQAINPNLYLTSNTASFPNANTPLYPFRRTDTQYWTSALAQSTTVFGYTYPELIGATRQSVIAAVNSLYAPSTGTGKRKRDLSATHMGEDQNNLRIARSSISTSFNEYLVRITISNRAAQGPFRIYIFLGEPSTPENKYTSDPNFLGFLGVFTVTDLPEKHRKIIQGTITLTAILEKLHAKGVLPDVNPSTISSYLNENLIWKITSNECPSYDLRGFEIDVLTSQVDLSCNNDELPMWGSFSTLYQLTNK